MTTDKQEWHSIIRKPFATNKEAVDILYWLEDNCQARFDHVGGEWHFELEQDAILFSLRWA
jgi:hypothetical protein